MRAFLSILFYGLLFCLAIYLGAFLFEQPGYVLVAYGQRYFEMTLITVLLILLGTWATLKIVMYVLRRTLRIGSATRFYFFNKSEKKAQQALRQGLTAFLLNDWSRAEKLLASAGHRSGMNDTKHLFAAVAADANGDDDKVQMHLNAIEDSDQDGQLLKAKLWFDREQWQQARAELEPVYLKNPKDNQLFALYIQILKGQQDWQTLLGLLAQIDKRQLYSEDQFNGLAATVCKNALLDTAAKATADEAEQQFNQLPAKYRKQPFAIAALVTLLAQAGRQEQAQSLLLKALKKGQIEDYLPVLRTVQFDQPVALNSAVQQALKNDENNPKLLAALGYLAASRGDWGLAAKALSQSIGPHSDTLDFKMLAKAYCELGESHAAVAIYQKMV